jgi:hypothetical protein
MCTEIFFGADVLDPPGCARLLQANDDVAVLPPIVAATAPSGHDVVFVRGSALGCNQFFDLRDVGRGVVLPAIGLTRVNVGADAVPAWGSSFQTGIRPSASYPYWYARLLYGAGRKVISAT